MYFVGTGGLLRFGHARVLTPHRGVIHCTRAASLPRRSVLIAQINDRVIFEKATFSVSSLRKLASKLVEVLRA